MEPCSSSLTRRQQTNLSCKQGLYLCIESKDKLDFCYDSFKIEPDKGRVKKKSVFFPLKIPKHLQNFNKLVLEMQNVMHIASNAGHTTQNDGRPRVMFVQHT